MMQRLKPLEEPGAKPRPQRNSRRKTSRTSVRVSFETHHMRSSHRLAVMTSRELHKEIFLEPEALAVLVLALEAEVLSRLAAMALEAEVLAALLQVVRVAPVLATAALVLVVQVALVQERALMAQEVQEEHSLLEVVQAVQVAQEAQEVQ